MCIEFDIIGGIKMDFYVMTRSNGWQGKGIEEEYQGHLEKYCGALQSIAVMDDIIDMRDWGEHTEYD